MASNRWIGFTVVFLASITIAMNQFKVPPVMVEMMGALNLDMVAGGMVMSVYALTVIILVFPAAFVLSKIGAKTTGLVAIGCSAVGPLLGVLTSNFHFLLISRVIEGVGSAFISVVAPTIIARSFNAKERGKPMGIWAGWVPIGVVLIFNLAVPLCTIFGGWRSLWWCCAGLNTIFFILFLIFIEKDTPASVSRSDTQKTGSGLSAFKNVAILALGLAFFGTAFRDVGFSTWAPKYFQDVLSIGASRANFLNSFAYLVQLVGTIVGGMLIDRGVSRKVLLMVSGVSTAVVAAFSFSLPALWILPFMFVVGLMAGFIVISCFTGAAGESADPSEIPWAVAIANFGCFLAIMIAPVAVGAMVESKGWGAGTLVVEIGAMVVILAGLVYARFSRCEKNMAPASEGNFQGC